MLNKSEMNELLVRDKLCIAEVLLSISRYRTRVGVEVSLQVKAATT